MRCCRKNKTVKLLTGITRSYGRLSFRNQKDRNNGNTKQNTPEVYINTQFYSIDLLPSTDGEIKLVVLHLRFERSTAWDTKGFSREHCNRRVSMGILQMNTEEKADHKAWYRQGFSLLEFKQPIAYIEQNQIFKQNQPHLEIHSCHLHLHLAACLEEPGIWTITTVTFHFVLLPDLHFLHFWAFCKNN